MKKILVLAMCTLGVLLGACLSDPDDVAGPDAGIEERGKSLGGGKTPTGPTEKDAYDVIAACLLTCFNRWTEMCPAMDTEAEYQVCADHCIYEVPPTVPAACEDEYSNLQHCRGDRLDSYYCSNGEAVSRHSCLLAQLDLAYCRQQSGVAKSKLLDDPTANIIVPPGGGCPNDMPDFCGPRDDEGAGGSGTGGGGGGGGGGGSGGAGGGSGSGVPGMGTGNNGCPPGKRYYPNLGRCDDPPGTVCDVVEDIQCVLNNLAQCVCPPGTPAP